MSRKKHFPCCNGMDSLVNSAGERGISVVLLHTEYGPQVRLQSRSVGVRDADALAAIESLDGSGKVSLVNQVGFQFCPFCGEKISESLSASDVYVKEMIEIHKDLII